MTELRSRIMGSFLAERVMANTRSVGVTFDFDYGYTDDAEVAPAMLNSPRILPLIYFAYSDATLIVGGTECLVATIGKDARRRTRRHDDWYGRVLSRSALTLAAYLMILTGFSGSLSACLRMV